MFTFNVQYFNSPVRPCVLITKRRPVWDWERTLKFSAPETDSTRQSAYWSVETIGL